jgi:response regulator RpfG family c-di-GMP phosphodiesterase
MAYEQKLLLVDDYEPNLVSLEAILDDDNWTLVKATSGMDALKLLLEHDFSLVLLDVQMPEMDGFEVAEMMRKNPRTQTVPIIFLTAISKEDKYIYKGYQAGAVDYLCKPINPTILRSKVEFFMKLDQQKKELEAKLSSAREHLNAYNETKARPGQESGQAES